MSIHTQTVAAQEAIVHFAELLGQVEDGAEVTITRGGAPVARLVPVRRKATPAERRTMFEAWNKAAAGLTLGGLRIKDLIEEGRR